MNLKKSFVVALVVSTGLSAHAKISNVVSSVRIPIVLGDDNGEIIKENLADVNKKLAALNMARIPSYVEISTATVKPYDAIQAVKDQVVKSLQAIGYKDGSLASQYVPGDLDAKAGVTTCYTGDATKAPELLGAGTDVVYSDQLSLLGYKYKTKKVVAGDLDGNDLKDWENNLNDESAAWKNYDKNSDSILILNAVGDDGTDVNESVIPRCK